MPPQTADLHDPVAYRASYALPEAWPEASAMRCFSEGQARCFRTFGVVPGVIGLLEPVLLIAGLWFLMLAGFAMLVAWRAGLLLVALWPLKRAKAPRALPEDQPVYTVLLPLFREAGSVQGLAEAMNRLRWPHERLDILVLLEAGDAATAAAAHRARWPAGTRIFILPEGEPRTKPRALNYGLAHARGTYLCIYDAEDRPHPEQLKAAAAAFAAGGPELACLQAPLLAHNRGESWLAAQWALEYDIQFRLLLPAMARCGLPFALGGTSNHFRTEMLRRALGWDAWNVTEDADLGVRLARLGARMGTIAPPTLEEAPETLPVWAAQRSRWIKGFLQTWLVLMRQPRLAVAELGPGAFLAFNAALLGTVLTALAHGPLLALVIVGAMSSGAWPGAFGLFLLLAGYAVNAAAGLAAPGANWSVRLRALATLPLYWPLHSLAAARAVYGLARRPHFWAKTPHALTRSEAIHTDAEPAPYFSTGSSP